MDLYEILLQRIILLKMCIRDRSQTWADKKAQEFVIPPTITRLRAKELIDNVKKAIDELNAFVEDNPNFGKGITTSQDSRRCCLLYTSSYQNQKNFVVPFSVKSKEKALSEII